MQKLMKEYLNELKKQQKRRRKVSIAVVLLVTLVVGTVTNGLTRYGSAMTGDVKCGLEEHQHTDECYQDVLICGYEEDTEDSTMPDAVFETEENTTSDATFASEPEESVKSENNTKAEEKTVITKETLACGQEEHEGHQHTDDCYEEESVLDCSLEEGEGHQHGDGCYEENSVLDCEQEESEGHQHGDGCYETESILTCDQEENEEHTHDDSCYTSESVLTCDQEESEGHQHGEECYKTESVLTCEQEESEGHQHGEECYKTESVLTCGQEEGEGHTHSDDCYVMETIEEEPKSSEATASEDNSSNNSAPEVKEEDTEPIEHTHTDECYERQLVCELEEHTHTDDCLIDHNADVEEASDWEAQYADVEWADAWGEDLVTAAKMQLDYQESLDNYQIAEDGSHKGYSRYGDFAGDAYADWDAAFVNFCIHYAGLPDEELFPDKIDADEWYKTFVEAEEKNQDYLTAKEDYNPVPGDLIFFESEDDDKEMRMGIVSSYEEGEPELKVIEGNSDNAVKENTYAVDDSEIAEYLQISEMEKVYKDRLSEEEQAQVDAVIALIEALPTQEEVTEKFAVFEEAEDEEGYQTYYLELLEQVRAAREAYEALSEKQKAAVTNVEKLLQYEWLQVDTMEEESAVNDIPEGAGFIPVDDASGKMIVELRYSDKGGYGEDKAEINFPHYAMKGYFDLYSKDIAGNLDMKDLTVTLHFPSDYINPDTIKLVPFSEDNIKHTISEVEEKDGYYDISVTFPNYQQTGQVQYEFGMSFYGGIVPEDYALKVYATISSGEGENKKTGDTKENVYRPKYKEPNLVKYVNTNKYDSMAVDYTKVSATIGEDGAINNNEYVSFWYKLGGAPWEFREYDQITLTDILPTYIDKTHNERIAVFDPELNPGWTLSEDGKTVSRTFKTDWSCKENLNNDHHWTAALQLMGQIEQAELRLKFPDCLIDEDVKDEDSTDIFLKKDLLNKAEADCHPRDPSAKEENDILKDELWFTLTNQPVGAGFAKYNSYNVLMDIKPMREETYRWGINFENSESVEPLTNITIKDYELDERLKIHSLRLETEDKEALTAQNRIAYVEAVTYEGDRDRYEASEFQKRPYNEGEMKHNQLLMLNPEKEYKEFIIYMKEDYELSLGQKIHIGVYTTFRSPEKSHFDEKDNTRNTYHNKAVGEYYVNNKKDKRYFLFSENQFQLIPATENVAIRKEIMYGEEVSPGTKDKFWNVIIEGSLTDGKDYEDLCIVDVLPEPFQFEGIGTDGKGLVKDIKVIEKFQNTGRTAVIFYMNPNAVKTTLGGKQETEKLGSASFTFKTSVPLDARVGRFDNEIYLLSEDFEKITTQAKRQDIYDLDDDGDTEEYIRGATASCLIKSPTGVFSEKLIAPEGSNAFHRNDLFLGVSDRFQYMLRVINMADAEHRGLTVYDVLPVIGDKSISLNVDRESEYAVKLSEAITPPAGYQVYYTTSQEVYKKSMAEILDAKDVTWEKDAPDNLDEVTAFKFVADEGTTITSKGSAEFRIPVKVTNTLDEKSYEILHAKEYTDEDNGTVAYLKSTNSFGYKVDTLGGTNLESNYVNALIPFAGFVVKKVDASEADKVLSGAEFKLEKQQSAEPDGSTEPTWEMVAQSETDEKGILSFRDLTEGTYRLIETKAPTGYNLNPTPIPVEIHLDRNTLEYRVTIDGNDHAGNSKDPFVITNQIFYELPSTGGTGAEPYAVAGTILMMAAFGILYRKKGRSKAG